MLEQRKYSEGKYSAHEKSAEEQSVFDGQELVREEINRMLEEIPSVTEAFLWKRLCFEQNREREFGDFILNDEEAQEHAVSCAADIIVSCFEKECGDFVDDERFQETFAGLTQENRKNIFAEFQNVIAGLDESIRQYEKFSLYFDGWLAGNRDDEDNQYANIPEYIANTMTLLTHDLFSSKGIEEFKALWKKENGEEESERKQPLLSLLGAYETVVKFLDKKGGNEKEDAGQVINALRGLKEKIKRREEIGQNIALETSPAVVVAIEKNADISLLETVHDGQWKEKLLSVLPDSFLHAVRRITFLPEMKSVEWASILGTYNRRKKEIKLSTEFISGHVLDGFRTLFHETGHAVDADGMGMRGIMMRYRFLEAVGREDNRVSAYAAETYKKLGMGMGRGLAEDFAESWSFFFSDPDLLKTVSPERYLAMEDIMAQYFPKVDIDKVRAELEATTAEFKKYPDTWRKLVEENGMNGAVGVFPFLNLLVPDIITTRGVSNTIEKRTIVGQGAEVVSEFGNKGELMSEYMLFKDGKRLELARNIQRDDLGRMVSFENGDAICMFAYEHNEDFPSNATLATIDGSHSGSLKYSRDGEKIREQLIDTKSPFWDNIYVAYTFGEKGQILQSAGYMGEHLIFARPYHYDNKGRVIEKSFLSYKGKEVEFLYYDYEGQ